MEVYREYATFWRGLGENKLDHGNILAVRLAELSGFWRIWMTDTRYDQANFLDKLVMLSYPTLLVFLFLSFLTFALQNRDDFPLPVIMQLFAYFLTSITYASGFYTFHMSRASTEALIGIVNEKHLAIMARANAFEYRRYSNSVYRIIAILAFIWTLSGISSSLPIIIEMCSGGRIFYSTPFPIDETPNGWQAITQNTVHSVVIAQMAQFYTFFWCIYIDVYVRIAWFFRILGDDLRNLRRSAVGRTPEMVVDEADEAEEERKFKVLLQEYQSLRDCVTLANGVVTIYMNAFVTLVYTTMGMIIALVASLDSVWEGVQFIFFPLYQYMILATFCYLGQHVMDAGFACRDAAYDSNWTTAPPTFKKLVLLFMNQCINPIQIDAKPFYELNFALLTKITKMCFSLIAIIKEME